MTETSITTTTNVTPAPAERDPDPAATALKQLYPKARPRTDAEKRRRAAKRVNPFRAPIRRND